MFGFLLSHHLANFILLNFLLVLTVSLGNFKLWNRFFDTIVAFWAKWMPNIWPAAKVFAIVLVVLANL